MDSNLKKNIRQDLQDYLDRKAFGLKVRFFRSGIRRAGRLLRGWHSSEQIC